MGKSNNEHRTLPEVLDLETGEIILASDFFGLPEEKIFATRRELELAIQGKTDPKFVCLYCKDHIKICGKPLSVAKKIKYFAHRREGEDCPLKSQNSLTREEIQRIKYNGAKESQLHIKLKEMIATNLGLNQEENKGVSGIAVEKVYRSQSVAREWRKPDVAAKYKDKNVVFELQLSTTFLSVIVSREDYYSRNKTFILWVFYKFDTNADLQRFTEKDIFYSNNRNAFVLSKKAQEMGTDQKDLVLLCYYQVPVLNHRTIYWKWEEKYVTLADLSYDANNYKVYFYDSDGEYEKLQKKIAETEAAEARDIEERKRTKEDKERKEYLDSAVEPTLELLRTFFKSDMFNGQITANLGLLSSSEITHLSNKLIKDYKGQRFLHYLLSTPGHTQFTSFLLDSPYFELGVNAEENGKCCLELAFDHIENSYFKFKIVQLLFKQGYNANLHQGIFLRLKEEINKGGLAPEQITEAYRYCAVVNLNDYALILKYEEIETVIFALYSVRYGKIIGSKLPNMIALANNFLQSYRGFTEMFLGALKRYNRYEEVATRDTFQKKLEQYQSQMPMQSRVHDAVFEKLFPKLFSI